MIGCGYINQRWSQTQTGEFTKYYEPCKFSYSLRTILFYNPDDVKDKDIVLLCESHFHETFDKYIRPEKIAESRYNSEFKKINNAKAELKEKKDYELYQQYLSNPSLYQKLNDLKKGWDYLKLKKCNNDRCENKLTGKSRKIFSVFIINQRGSQERKLNFCSYQCWMIVKIYIGIKRIEPNKPNPSTLDNYTEQKEMNQIG